MNNSQVAHVWAQQTKESGSGSHFYFDGPTLYSYGRHFIVAEFAKNKKGATCVLFNNRAYSVSTSRHQSYARRAVRDGVQCFSVPNPDAGPLGHADNLADYAARYRDAITKATRARREDNAKNFWTSAGELRSAAIDYARFFGVRFRPSMFPDVTSADVIAKFKAADAKEKARQVRERKAAEKARAEADAKRAADYQTALTDWRAFNRDSVPYNSNEPIALRVNVAMQRIETTWGAQCPVADALRVWPLFQSIHESGINRPGFSLGEFFVDRIEADGTLIAGCHRVAFAEIAACARTLGLLA